MLIFAVLLAAVGAYGLIKMNRAMVGAVPVVVANTHILPHTKITPDMLEVQEYARGLVKSGMIAQKEGAVDKITRGYIPAGTPVYGQQLADPGDNTLTTQLSEMENPLFRAKSLPVEAIYGLNGRLSPGDRVDLTGSMQVPLNGIQTKISHTFAKDVEIMEVIGVGEGMRGIILAVLPQQGQDMDFVVNNGGKIGIKLRPYKAKDTPTEPTTPETFISRYLTPKNTAEENTQHE